MLVAVIKIDIPGSSDEQLIHCAVHHLSAQDVPKRMQDCGDLHGDGEEQGLVEPVREAEAGMQQIDQEVQSEEHKWTEPCDRRDEELHVPELPDGNPTHSIDIFDDAIFKIPAHVSLMPHASFRWQDIGRRDRRSQTKAIRSIKPGSPN